MYIPHHFQSTNIEEIKDFIKANSFGILVSHNGGLPWATHIPLLLETGVSTSETILSGHISKSNKQYEHFIDNDKVLVIFSGPHAYISSSWYDHENVPTWNYVAVHLYGTIKIIEGENLREKLSNMVDNYEGERKDAISLKKMTPAYVDAHINGIIGFEIVVDDIQAAYKLSQNRDEKNYKEIIKQLDDESNSGSKDLADEMKKIYNKKYKSI